MLQLDIRSVHQGRGKGAGGVQDYCCRIDALQLSFTTHEEHVEVTACALASEAGAGAPGSGGGLAAGKKR
eukprot:978875-Prymnesium_polylepis.1